MIRYPLGQAPIKHKFTIDELYRMQEAFAPDQCIELIEGDIIDMSPINAPHAICMRKLIRFFQQNLPLKDYVLDFQDPVLLSKHSLLQPDVVIAHYRPELLENTHIQAADIALLIEISDTTYQYDLHVKLPLYAAANIPVYWIVNLNQKQVEVYTQPQGNQYAHSQIYQETFEALPGMSIHLHDIFPGQ